MDGEMKCSSEHIFPIIHGIPRLLPPGLLDETLKRFHPSRYGGGTRDDSEEAESISKRTIRSFGYQWNVFSEMYDHWQENFRSYFEPLLPLSRFEGKTILDAGCGFGRHAYYAGAHGKELVAMDLSEAVDAAFNNTRELDNVHVVQGDIYNPPLMPIFDLVYSVGVIQHLPDPAKGFRRLGSVLKDGASLFVWVYGRRTGMYRLVDSLRRITVRLPMRSLFYFTFVLNLASFIAFSLPFKILSSFPGGRKLASAWPFTRYANLPLRVGHADWFDRLSAPSTVYFSQSDVETWYRESGMRDFEVRSRDGIGWCGLGKHVAAKTEVSEN